MRKTKFSAVISTAIVCYLFWLLLSEQAVALIHGHASGQALFAGVIVCLAAGLFSSRFFIHTNPFHLFHPGRLLNLLVYCLIIFPWELIKANVSVAICALKPSLPINPGIVKRSAKTYYTEEGCLSIDGKRAVKRHSTVMVAWTDGKGKRKTKEFNGYTAEILQHEIDHCNGVLIGV